jgi:putative SOS response-associated peptidase YedK
MCGRYTLRTPWQRLADHFGMPVTDVPELFADRYNIAPTGHPLAIRHEPDELDAMAASGTMNNARREEPDFPAYPTRLGKAGRQCVSCRLASTWSFGFVRKRTGIKESR